MSTDYKSLVNGEKKSQWTNHGQDGEVKKRISKLWCELAILIYIDYQTDMVSLVVIDMSGMI